MSKGESRVGTRDWLPDHGTGWPPSRFTPTVVNAPRLTSPDRWPRSGQSTVEVRESGAHPPGAGGSLDRSTPPKSDPPRVKSNLVSAAAATQRPIPVRSVVRVQPGTHGTSKSDRMRFRFLRLDCGTHKWGDHFFVPCDAAAAAVHFVV